MHQLCWPGLRPETTLPARVWRMVRVLSIIMRVPMTPERDVASRHERVEHTNPPQDLHHLDAEGEPTRTPASNTGPSDVHVAAAPCAARPTRKRPESVRLRYRPQPRRNAGEYQQRGHQEAAADPNIPRGSPPPAIARNKKTFADISAMGRYSGIRATSTRRDIRVPAAARCNPRRNSHAAAQG